MKLPIAKKYLILIAVAIALVAGILVLANRVYLGDLWYKWWSPDLPPAADFQGAVAQAENSVVTSEASPFESGLSKSENFVLETSPTVKTTPADPLAHAGPLPMEVNLDVPFTSQAPFADWNMPFQEFCEEASLLMTHAFYEGESGVIEKYTARERLKKIMAFENFTFGSYEDATAEQVADVAKNFYGYKTVVVKPLTSVLDIKVPLALGYPVLIPAAGQLLGNPNFSGDGPPYHMLVIRGYTPGFFITNDPGTRRGQGYTYSYDTILKAAHDWTGDKATIQTGKPMMIVVIPNK